MSPHLEEGHGGAVADAEQEERDEDGDGCPEPVQLPILGVRTALLLQEQVCTGRGGQCCLCPRGAGQGHRGLRAGLPLGGRWRDPPMGWAGVT